MKKVLVIGATSAIAEHCARIWAARGDAMFLVARNKKLPWEIVINNYILNT